MRGGKQTAYQLRPDTALAYLAVSSKALTRSAMEVHVGHVARAFAEMKGAQASLDPTPFVRHVQ